MYGTDQTDYDNDGQAKSTMPERYQDEPEDDPFASTLGVIDQLHKSHEALLADRNYWRGEAQLRLNQVRDLRDRLYATSKHLANEVVAKSTR